MRRKFDPQLFIRESAGPVRDASTGTDFGDIKKSKASERRGTGSSSKFYELSPGTRVLKSRLATSSGSPLPPLSVHQRKYRNPGEKQEPDARRKTSTRWSAVHAFIMGSRGGEFPMRAAGYRAETDLIFSGEKREENAAAALFETVDKREDIVTGTAQTRDFRPGFCCSRSKATLAVASRAVPSI
ncbi:hypothetical protein MTO96_014434 [Rhipicephalus appendiculatus]